jgi:hypothetical protein
VGMKAMVKNLTTKSGPGEHKLMKEREEN